MLGGLKSEAACTQPTTETFRDCARIKNHSEFALHFVTDSNVTPRRSRTGAGGIHGLAAHA